ncbi:hypothetical protein C8Q78DRAFT_1052554 [Trametes maxima]|nr:hypothetical protein C8Q78DRAFT_1052554 [Trametes maxima]
MTKSRSACLRFLTRALKEGRNPSKCKSASSASPVSSALGSPRHSTRHMQVRLHGAPRPTTATLTVARRVHASGPAACCVGRSRLATFTAPIEGPFVAPLPHYTPVNEARRCLLRLVSASFRLPSVSRRIEEKRLRPRTGTRPYLPSLRSTHPLPLPLHSCVLRSTFCILHTASRVLPPAHPPFAPSDSSLGANSLHSYM